MEELLNWIGLTAILFAVVLSIIISEAWSLGRDFIYVGKNKARHLNCVEKWLDGFKRLLQI